jgi:hypothetical protein
MRLWLAIPPLVAKTGPDTACFSVFILVSRRAWDGALGVNRVCLCSRLFVEVAVLVAVVDCVLLDVCLLMALQLLSKLITIPPHPMYHDVAPQAD